MEFEAPLWQHAMGEAGWYFLTLPDDVAQEVRDLDTEPRKGFGSIRVRVTVEPTTWDTSVFPDKDSGSFVLPVKAAVRKAAGLEAGEVVRVHLEMLTR